MKIESIELRHLSVPMKEPFETSTEVKDHIEHILITIRADGIAGFGETTCNQTPYYINETTGTAWEILTRFVMPHIVGLEIRTIDDLLTNKMYKAVRGNHFAKAGLETAVWDLLAKAAGTPLSRMLGGNKSAIESGVSIGVQKDIPTLLRKVEGYVQQGYKRVKIKIKPGNDYTFLAAVRKEFPGVPVMADANSAYTLAHTDLFRKMDELELMMFEQPLAYDDIVDHAKLQQEIKTPICLDESIHTVEDARKAIELGSCRIINIKIGRVGGLMEAKKIHDLCESKGIPVWCGGMHEFGVGRAHNIALNSLSNFTLPGDVAGSDKDYERDIVEPALLLKNGCMEVPQAPGIGVTPQMAIIEKYTQRVVSF